MPTTPRDDQRQAEEIAERVAETLQHESVEGRQPLPPARRVSFAVLGAALILTSVLLLVAGVKLGAGWTLLGGVMVALALFLVAGFPIVTSMMMRLREETSARRRAEGGPETIERGGGSGG
jgi:hypothetical protein